MIRVLVFFIMVFALGLGFAWLAERPGELVVTFGGYQYEVTLMVAAVMLTALIACVMIAWWLVKAIWNSPYTVARYFRVRRRDRGYQALSTGMIAAGAGDGALARKMNRQASKLIDAGREPLIHLLDAQASLIDGDHAAARKKFEAMLEDPEMRVLGLRGLYLEAERLGDRDAARHYAERAAGIAPQLGWASSAALDARASQGDWDGALSLLDAQKSTRQIEPAKANRRRAVLLAAKAISLADVDPLAAKNAAIEANRLAPELVPAAVIAAKALFRQGDLRKGAKILEAAWRKEAHPDIADAYVHARPGDSTHDRLTRARKLKAQRENNAESSLAVARAALDAAELKQAREAAEEAIRIAPREGAYLLMADIEEADTGDQGRIRQWLSRAVKAQRDPVWIADGVVSERWAPVSPVTGRLDAFEWRTPVERPLSMIEDVPEPRIEVASPLLPAIAPETPGAPADVADATDARGVDEPASGVPATETPQQPTETPAPERPMPTLAAANDDAGATDAAEPIVVPRPDDPGVDPNVGDGASPRRFRLF